MFRTITLFNRPAKPAPVSDWTLVVTHEGLSTPRTFHGEYDDLVSEAIVLSRTLGDRGIKLHTARLVYKDGKAIDLMGAI
jgi:hypothetical protein